MKKNWPISLVKVIEKIIEDQLVSYIKTDNKF